MVDKGKHIHYFQVLTLIVLIIVRTSFGSALRVTAFAGTDHMWLTIIATGGYTIILAAMLLTYLTGDAMSDFSEMCLMLLGGILFIACGAMAIDTHHNLVVRGQKRDTGLAWGSLAVINGVVMIVDGILLAKAKYKK